MSLLPIAARPRAVAALAAAATAAVAVSLAAAPAHAATPTAKPPALSPNVSKAISSEGLNTEVINGWKAVTGPAAKVNEVRAMAVSDRIGTVAEYTGNDETGQAILIFTGADNQVLGFHVTGGAIRSVDNATDQVWYVYDDSVKEEVAVPAHTAKNVQAPDARISNSSSKPKGISFAL